VSANQEKRVRIIDERSSSGGTLTVGFYLAF
jgi:hypothetical protein